MFLTTVEIPDISVDIKSIKQMLDGFDPVSLLPSIDTLVGKVQLVCVIALLAGPLIIYARTREELYQINAELRPEVGMGLVYLLFAPKEANYYLGYRTAFGMGSVSAWRRTQKLAGMVFGILGGVLTVLMLLIAMTLSARAPMDMVWLTVKCLLWQGGLTILAIAAINVITTSRFDYRGSEKRCTVPRNQWYFDDEFYRYLDFVQYRIFDLLDFVNPAERIAFRCVPCDGHDKERDYSDVN